MTGVILGQFSTLKFINGSNFKKFKEFFLAEYISGFVVPAETFDNVKGKFPIGFTIWNTTIKSKIDVVSTDVFDKKGNYISNKNFYGDLPDSINKWVKLFDDKSKKGIGFMENPAPDFQNNKFLNFTVNIGTRHVNYYSFNFNNLIQGLIYFSIRNCIIATWLNDRDQYLYPTDGWQTDKEFQNNCLAFSLFHGQNKITNSEGINHWIPFTELEINAKAKFASNFMTDFIKGKVKKEVSNETLFMNETIAESKPLVFSEEATAVFDSGRELWEYYHAQNDVDINVNASFYDIRAYFQGTNVQGRMNARSEDATYTKLIGELRNKLSILADKIKPKVYEYGFLKE
jgi:hypothetical protein